MPRTQSDLYFADELTLNVFLSAQMPGTRHDYSPYLVCYDFYTTKAQVERFPELSIDAVNMRPHWSNRG